MTIGKKTTYSVPPGSTALVIGATSSLAQAICRKLARKGYRLLLVGRDERELELLAGDLATRFGASCRMLVCDLLDPRFSPEMLVVQAGDFEQIIIASGDMGSGDPADLPNIAQTIAVNYTIPAQIATIAALRLSEKGSGGITIISSVAGDRGRQSNYAYGSAKAALSTFASGLRNRFYPSGVQVTTIKPGFIDTPLTWGMKSPLIASRDYAAEKIIAAMERKKDVVYIPFFWRGIMLVIQHIPEAIFKRLKL